jgi:hypothetical protein
MWSYTSPPTDDTLPPKNKKASILIYAIYAGSIPVFLMNAPKSGAVSIFRNVIAAVGAEAALWTPAE